MGGGFCRPNGRAIGGVTHRDRGPQGWPRSTVGKHRAAAKRRALSPSVASPAARSSRAQKACPLRRLHHLPLGLAAVDRLARQCGTISAVSKGVRDPVDEIASADPFADHGIPAFAQPSERRPRRVRQPSRCLRQINNGRAVGALQTVRSPAPACYRLAGRPSGPGGRLRPDWRQS